MDVPEEEVEMAGGRDFDSDRFEELVLYIAWKTRHNRNFGRVRISKVLFYVDFSHYADSGESLTGATYIAEEFGPFPSYLTTAEEHLVHAGLARADRIESTERGEFDENRVIPLKEPVVRLDGYVQAVVDQWIKSIASISSAQRLSKQTHDLPGWKLARPKKAPIPYESIFIGTDRPPDRAVERGRELVGEFKWEQRV